MTCTYHRGLCAFPDWHESRCEYCHSDWAKITSPATRITTRQMTNRKGETISAKDIAYLNGYGETPLNHLWRHAVDLARAQRSATDRAAGRTAA